MAKSAPYPFSTVTAFRLKYQHPAPDICDQMKGDYPKDFLFRGWHPQCFCYTTSILLSGKEYRLLQATGEQPTRMVDDLPKQAQNYLKTYGEALKKLNSVPYFIRDNNELLGRS